MKRASFGFLALGVALLGCPATTTTGPYTPITGIQVNAASLVYGIGCGTANDQVFMYAGVVSYTIEADASFPQPPPDALPSGVYDCFANGIFSNLPASEAGTLNFTVQIFAFNEASFPPELSCAEDAGVLGGTHGVTCPGDTPTNVIKFEHDANWTTTCTGTQVPGATVPAVCGPLVPTRPVPGDGGENDSAVAD